MATPVSHTGARLDTPSGSLVLRVWWESGSTHPFRARLLVVDPNGHTAELGTTADPTTAMAKVQEWVEEFINKAEE